MSGYGAGETGATAATSSPSGGSAAQQSDALDPVTVARELTTALERMSVGVSRLTDGMDPDDQFVADLAIALFHLSPDAIIVFAADGTICLVNTQAEWLTGYQFEALRGEAVEMLIPPGVRDRHRSTHRVGYMADLRVRPMETGPDLNIRLLHRDGRQIPVDINLAPVVTGAGTFVVAIVRRRIPRWTSGAGRGTEATENVALGSPPTFRPT